jgi:hypothetical protein
MAPKKPTVQTKLQQKADKSNKILTGPKGSKPQSTTNARLMKQGDKTTMSGPARTRFQNPSRGGSTTKSQTVGGGGKNLFGGAGSKANAKAATSQAAPKPAFTTNRTPFSSSMVGNNNQGGPKAPKPAFQTRTAPFSRTGPARASIGNVRGPATQSTPRQQARAQGQAAVKAAQQRRAERNLAQVQKDLRNSTIGKAATMLGGAKNVAYQAIAESVAPRPSSKLAGLKEGQAAAKATMAAKNKAKAKSADSFGGQYQKGSPSKKAAPKMSKAKSFDNAFASARNSGMKTFTWEGKRYTTKMK